MREGTFQSGIPAAFLFMQVGTSAIQLSSRIDPDAFRSAYNADQFPLGKHLPAAHAGALRNMPGMPWCFLSQTAPAFLYILVAPTLIATLVDLACSGDISIGVVFNHSCRFLLLFLVSLQS